MIPAELPAQDGAHDRQAGGDTTAADVAGRRSWPALCGWLLNGPPWPNPRPRSWVRP